MSSNVDKTLLERLQQRRDATTDVRLLALLSEAIEEITRLDRMLPDTDAHKDLYGRSNSALHSPV